MPKNNIDPMQKLKNQLADQKQMVSDLKLSVRELKQQLKDKKVEMKSVWQDEIEIHTEKALSVGYELGYLEAVSAQRDASDQLRADIDALCAVSPASVSVDFSALNDVLTEAASVHQPVPMPEPVLSTPAKVEVVATVVEVAVEAEQNDVDAEQEKQAEFFSIESIVRDIVSQGEAVLSSEASESSESRDVLELVLEDA